MKTVGKYEINATLLQLGAKKKDNINLQPEITADKNYDTFVYHST